MKVIPGILVLVAGIGIGWLARGPSEITTTKPIPPKSRTTERPASSRQTTSPPSAASLPKQLFGSSPTERRQWFDRIDSENWRAYLDEALSSEGTSRNLLTDPNIENIEFLQRIGEVSKDEGVRILLDRKLEFAAAQAMEGWSNLDPRGAFAWAKGTNDSDRIDEYGPVFAKAAGAMVDVDFDEVWKTIRMIQPPLAKEFIRRKGVEEMDRILLKCWTSPDNRLPRSDFLSMQTAFEGWDDIAFDTISRSKVRSGSNYSWDTWIKLRIDRNNWLLSNALNPDIRRKLEGRNQALIHEIKPRQ